MPGVIIQLRRGWRSTLQTPCFVMQFGPAVARLPRRSSAGPSREDSDGKAGGDHQGDMRSAQRFDVDC